MTARSGRVALALLLLPLFAGCFLERAGTRVLSNRVYTKDGFAVTNEWGRYEHRESAKQDTLTVHNGYDTQELVDNNADGKVDVITFKGQKYYRDEQGIAEMFARADDDWCHYTHHMQIPESMEEWRASSPDDLARREGYFKR